MKKFDEILIIGDSFCAKTGPDDWPTVLGKLSGLPVTCYGRAGQSWWTYKKDLDKFKFDTDKKTLLIVIHTEPIRLPNDKQISATPGILNAAPGDVHDLSRFKDSNELTRIAKDFYLSSLFSKEFYEWAQQAWIKELEMMAGPIKIIHIPGFDTVKLDDVKNGIIALPSPNIYSLRTLSNNELLGEEPGRWQGPDIRSNHFNKTNNKKLAEALSKMIEIIDINDTGIRYFNNLDQWDFTKVPFQRPKTIERMY